MNKLIINQSELFQWYQLISEARKVSLINLVEDVESYLVFLLMRFMNNPEIAKSILSIEYLEGLNHHFQLQRIILQDVGDKCLLMAGLFPGRAQKRRVKISYFVKLGQNAYSALGRLSSTERSATLYNMLSQDFVSMMDVLQTTRDLDNKRISQLDIFEAYELWSDTNSTHALKILQQYTNLSSMSRQNSKNIH